MNFVCLDSNQLIGEHIIHITSSLEFAVLHTRVTQLLFPANEYGLEIGRVCCYVSLKYQLIYTSWNATYPRGYKVQTR
jgi:hypothetical protein